MSSSSPHLLSPRSVCPKEPRLRTKPTTEVNVENLSSIHKPAFLNLYCDESHLESTGQPLSNHCSLQHIGCVIKVNNLTLLFAIWSGCHATWSLRPGAVSPPVSGIMVAAVALISRLSGNLSLSFPPPVPSSHSVCQLCSSHCGTNNQTMTMWDHLPPSPFSVGARNRRGSAHGSVSHGPSNLAQLCLL